MAIVRKFKRLIIGSKKRKIIDYILKCDECDKIYTPTYYGRQRVKKRKHHFCSRKCSTKSLIDGKLKQETTKTNLKKYGAECFAASKIGKETIKRSIFEKYGVNSVLKLPEIRNKIGATNLQKYGNKIYTGTEDHKSKIDHVEIAQKAWKTKIANGTCSKSKPEERLYVILKNEFGKIDIKRQINVMRQWVDFYIKSLNMYIQVDGIYWHGLNRPIKQIKEQKTTQDVKIYKQILRDRKLNKYMKKNGIKMIRITDKQMNGMTDKDIISFIRRKI